MTYESVLANIDDLLRFDFAEHAALIESIPGAVQGSVDEKEIEMRARIVGWCFETGRCQASLKDVPLPE